MSETSTCELCAWGGGEVVFRSERLRVVLVADANYPGFCRVVWNAHVGEMSDLTPQEREVLMSAVWVTETAVREVMRPDKINLASFGNVVPHLHWHVIPRYQDDMHFPNPVWGEAKRNSMQEKIASRTALLPELKQVLASRMMHLG